jgi:hypothetical protein
MLIYNCRKTKTLKPKQKGKVNSMQNFNEKKFLTVSVEQMINDRGNGAMNQFVIHDGNLLMFQSYNSLIAVVNYDTREIILGSDWDYSVTTGKHRNIFFRDYAHIPELITKKGIDKALKYGKCNGWEVKLVS